MNIWSYNLYTNICCIYTYFWYMICIYIYIYFFTTRPRGKVQWETSGGIFSVGSLSKATGVEPLHADSNCRSPSWCRIEEHMQHGRGKLKHERWCFFMLNFVSLENMSFREMDLMWFWCFCWVFTSCRHSWHRIWFPGVIIPAWSLRYCSLSVAWSWMEDFQ